MIVSPSLYQHALAAITRRYPFLSGTALIPNSLTFTRISGSKNAEGWTSTPGGEIYARLNDYVGRAVFFFGDLDPKLTSVAKRLIRNGDTVLDIGANIGLMTLQFVDLVGPGGSVHSFEPNPDVLTLLAAAVNRKGANNVTLNEVALGDKPGVLNLSAPQANVGAGSIVRGSDWVHAQIYPVQVMRLDDYVSQQGIDAVDIIKIDVEGAEATVFEGARNLLQNNPPRAILFEDNEREENKISPAMGKLIDFGYGFIALPKSLLGLKPRILDPAKEPIIGHDFIAAKLGSHLQDLCSQLSN
jgi:FkbM family methyltransferase